VAGSVAELDRQHWIIWHRKTLSQKEVAIKCNDIPVSLTRKENFILIVGGFRQKNNNNIRSNHMSAVGAVAIYINRSDRAGVVTSL